MPPARTSQPQYESLRAYFIEGFASAQVARRFGYPAAAFRMLCYDFRRVNCQISCREAAGLQVIMLSLLGQNLLAKNDRLVCQHDN
jgi:hypothetical protein